MKKYLIGVILLFSIFINSSNASNNIVGPYNTLQECSEIRNENNNKPGSYQDYERSKCYLENGKYQYNICKKGEGCINDTFNQNINTINIKDTTHIKNPYADKTIKIKGKKIKLSILYNKIQKIIETKKKGKTLKAQINSLTNFYNLIEKIRKKEKYKNNELVQNLVGYINFEVKKEINSLKEKLKEQENINGVNEFLCEISGDCTSTGKDKVCTDEYKPVCAQPPMPTCPKGAICKMIPSQPKTYSNSCIAKKLGARILYNGKCKTYNQKEKCIGIKPTGEGIFLSKDEKKGNYITWHYSENTKSDWNCAWKCKNGYVKQGNSCIKNNISNKFLLGKIVNKYRYFEINYKYGKNNDIIFSYQIINNNNYNKEYKFTNNSGKIILGLSNKYKIIPGEIYEYKFYDTKTNKLIKKGYFKSKVFRVPTVINKYRYIKINYIYGIKIPIPNAYTIPIKSTNDEITFKYWYGYDKKNMKEIISKNGEIILNNILPDKTLNYAFYDNYTNNLLESGSIFTKTFKITKTINKYKYFELDYKYGYEIYGDEIYNNDEIIFVYWYNNNKNNSKKIINKSGKIILNNIIPGKKYSYRIYDAYSKKYTGFGGFFTSPIKNN